MVETEPPRQLLKDEKMLFVSSLLLLLFFFSNILIRRKCERVKFGCSKIFNGVITRNNQFDT